MAERLFLGKGLPESERNALLRSGVFDRDLFQAVHSRDWRRKYTPVEIERMRLLETQELGSGWAYRGDLWGFYNLLRKRALDAYWDRQFRTGQNLTDPLGAVGYGIGLATGTDPDVASDVGATLGAPASALAGGPRYRPAPIQKNQPVQTISGRGILEPTNPTFIVAPGRSTATAKSAPPPAPGSGPSGPPQASQRATQRPAPAALGSRDIENRIEAPASRRSGESKPPVSARTGEQDPLGAKRSPAQATPPPSQHSHSDAPPPKTKRRNIRDVLPLKPSSSKTEPQRDPAESGQETKSASPPLKPQGTAPGQKVKPADRAPSPRDVEKGTLEAIERDAPGLPSGSQIVSRGESFNTITDRLQALRAATPSSPNLKPLDGLNRDVLQDNAWQLVERQASAGRPALKDAYTRLLRLAELRDKRGEPTLKTELENFMKSGRLGARKPDSLVLVDEGAALNFVLTDPTVKEVPVKLMVHDFKALFYREGMHALLGNNPNAKVESWEHNPKLGIHREAQGVDALPPY